MDDETVLRLRAALTLPGVTRKGFAKAAGLPENALNECLSDDWNPTLKTLTAVRNELDRIGSVLGQSDNG